MKLSRVEEESGDDDDGGGSCGGTDRAAFFCFRSSCFRLYSRYRAKCGGISSLSLKSLIFGDH